MRTTRWMLLLALAAAAPAATLAAQDDGDDGAQGQLLRQQIEDRFAARVREELALSDEQAAKLRATSVEFAGRRRTLQQRERGLRRALAGQLRPGIAADQDSVQKLTDALLDVKEDHVKSARDELRAMAYLSPLQRAQFFALRERLLERVQQFRQQRQEQGVAQPGRRIRR